MNPSKPYYTDARKIIEQVLAKHNNIHYCIKSTTVEHPGNLQAVEAIDQGYDVIVACGGDGTIRSVACGIAKYADHPKTVEMGLIPLGTGNIFAYNLGLLTDDVEKAMQVALSRKAQPIDIGFCRTIENKEFEHAFTTIAGVGFDANMVKATDNSAKERIGALAYYIAGVRQAFSKRPTAIIKIRKPDNTIIETTTKFRTIMVGNCGQIPGFTLIPQAVVNDGILDLAAVDTSIGLIGWMQLGFDIMLQNFNIQNNFRYKAGRIDHTQCISVTIILKQPQEVQLDGDLIGKTRQIRFTVRPQALLIRY